MFGTRWRLFRLLGIPISVDASWLVILALLTLSIATDFPGLTHAYFPEDAARLGPAAYWVMGLVTALAFFGCILLHELGHAVVARARGMSIRGITLFLFGGVAGIGAGTDMSTGRGTVALARRRELSLRNLRKPSAIRSAGTA